MTAKSGVSKTLSVASMRCSTVTSAAGTSVSSLPVCRSKQKDTRKDTKVTKIT